MRRTLLSFSLLLTVSGLCLAQQQAGDTSTAQQSRGDQEQQPAQSDQASLRDPLLDKAPDAVKEEILRHAASQTLTELDAEERNGTIIYEAVFEDQNVETRLRLGESGQPISMHIAGLGAPINEAAGARRDDQPQAAPTQAQSQQPSSPQKATVPDELKQRIQQQLGDETPLLDVQPKVFYQLNIRQNGNVQQIWADENGKVLRDEQRQQ